MVDSGTSRMRPGPTPLSHVDLALAAQLAVAWAGESGEDKRLGWWRTDLASEFGGEDLFRRLLPSTWRWAVLQAAREAGRRKDAKLRRKAHDPDQIISLFNLGYDLDARIEDRLGDLKRGGHDPLEALPGLKGIVDVDWDQDRFLEWASSQAEVKTSASPAGRRIKGEPPPDLEARIRSLLAALTPLSKSYPLPHFRRKA